MFKEIPVEYYQPALAFLLLGLVVIFVPKEEFRKLFWLAFLWGYIGSKIFVVILDLLNFTKWEYIIPFEFLGVPHWLVFGWGLTMILFFSFMPKSKEWYAFPSYLFIFALASAALDNIFHNAGLLVYIHWNPCYRLVLTYLWFYGAARHYNYLVSKGRL